MKLNDITKKIPFIYELNEDYYVLGQGCLKRVSGNSFAVYRYRQYKSVIDSVDTNKLRCCDEDVSAAVIYLFKKMKSHADCLVKDRNNSERELLEFFDSLDDESKVNLSKQLEDFVNVSKYCYRNK